MDPIRVMVVDDSPFMRRALERMLACDDIQVVGSARDGVRPWRSCPSSTRTSSPWTSRCPGWTA